MRAVVHSGTGPADILHLVDREEREPGPGEVRVRVRVSGVNPTDWKRRNGVVAAPDHEPEHDVVPNQDGAGIVDAVGEGVDDLAVGDRVWLMMSAYGRGTGTAQESTVVPSTRAIPLPDAASFDVGACLGVPAVTAHRALTMHEHGPRRLFPGALAGRNVLVAGGAGAVGHAAVQLARWADADVVVATASTPEKRALARRAGAHAAVDHGDPDAAARILDAAPAGIDIVVEVSPARNAALDAAVLADHGLVSAYGAEGGRELSLDVVTHFTRNIRYQFVLLYTLSDGALRAAAEDITAALESGALPVGVDAGLPLTRFPLDRTPDAHRAVEGGTTGKVLIDVSR
ncbi:NADPH:quinone reductase [Microbacterium pseudoresistens]|uniref:NADPH2:quinone reductase n=1 Tax=Microbacterium pseudoresistens TaxID=640634 RepID=A0A7Y9EW54_9MICO|nr:NADPH:quinone reductase [Microbacterium pseudoresistens]NYD54916.1 NADPH2:quinone reductase [Microbacterium pseudoresistens]